MHPFARRVALWPLLLAFSLAATVAGHALELAVENAGVLGEGRAGYEHMLQGPVEIVAVGLVLFTLVALGISVAHSIGARGVTAASILPAMVALRRLGPSRIALRLASLQFPALIAIELGEQRLSGIAHPTIAAVFGTGHWTAPIVYLAVVVLSALSLAALARMSCDHADDIVRAARTIARILIVAPRAVLAPIVDRPASPNAHTAVDHPLAFQIANRPPPAIAAARA